MNRSHLSLALAPLFTLLAACTVESTGPQSPAPSPSSESGSTAPAPEHKVACDGTVTALAPAALPTTRLSIRCGDGSDGTRGCGEPGGEGDGGAAQGERGCDADDVAIRHEGPPALCVASEVFFWDGARCVGEKTVTDEGEARCAGADCPHLAKSLDECENAHAACKGER